MEAITEEETAACVLKFKYSVGQNVRISREKAKFAKSSEQNLALKDFGLSR